MAKLNWLYRQINLLSLDIATGVVICTLFFARIFQAHTRPQGMIVLWLTVWIIYTADHLLDAYRIKGKAATERHRFHQQHFFVLIMLLGLGLLINGILVFFLKAEVFHWGVWLIVVVFGYLVFQKHLRFFKEFIAATLYSGGVLLPPLALSPLPLDFFKAMLLLQFFLIAWSNLILFSWFDEENDIRDKHNSFVTTMGRTRTGIFLALVFAVSVALCVFQFSYHTPWLMPIVILMVMNGVLIFIFLNRSWFTPYDRFRLWGDAVFLFPIVFLI